MVQSWASAFGCDHLGPMASTDMWQEGCSPAARLLSWLSKTNQRTTGAPNILTSSSSLNSVMQGEISWAPQTLIGQASWSLFKVSLKAESPRVGIAEHLTLQVLTLTSGIWIGLIFVFSLVLGSNPRSWSAM